MRQRKILLLRHQNAADRTATNLKDLGFQSIILPLSKIDLLSNDLPADPFGGVILTSPIAAQTLQNLEPAASLQKLPVYCVGKYTARCAKAAGFSQIIAIEKDAESLAGVLKNLKSQQRLIYPCAKNRSFNFGRYLESYDIGCRNWEIYSNELITPEQKQLATALDETDTLFLYSKRTASHFFKIADLNKNFEPGFSKQVFIAISAQVGRTVPRKFLANTYIANEKSESGMISCLEAVEPNA